MPNYSSSKSAWPTFNLPNMGGGGVTRPMIRMIKTKESTHTQVGPTLKASAEKARTDATNAYELRKAEARAAKKSGKRTVQKQADYDAVYAGTADAAAQARFDKGADKEAMAADKREGAQDAAERAAIKKQDAAFEKQKDAKMLKDVSKFDAAEDSAVAAQAKREAARAKKLADDTAREVKEQLDAEDALDKAPFKIPAKGQTGSGYDKGVADQETTIEKDVNKFMARKNRLQKNLKDYYAGTGSKEGNAEVERLMRANDPLMNQLAAAKTAKDDSTREATRAAEEAKRRWKPGDKEPPAYDPNSPAERKAQYEEDRATIKENEDSYTPAENKKAYADLEAKYGKKQPYIHKTKTSKTKNLKAEAEAARMDREEGAQQ